MRPYTSTQAAAALEVPRRARAPPARARAPRICEFDVDLVRDGRAFGHCPRDLRRHHGGLTSQHSQFVTEAMERPPPRNVRIFLASSAELKEHRDEFEQRVGRLDRRWTKRGLRLETVRWE